MYGKDRARLQLPNADDTGSVKRKTVGLESVQSGGGGGYPCSA